MSYSEFLEKSIQESGLSLTTIATLCEQEYNVKLTPSFLSKLQKGLRQPATKEANTAIAKVCGISPEDLQFEADFERAPESVKQLTNQMVNFLKNIFIQAFSEMQLEDKDLQSKLNIEIKKYSNMTTREFVQNINVYEEFFNSTNPLSFNFGDMPETQNTELENMFMKLCIGKTMLDNSMFPLIKQGAKLEMIALDEYQNGDIVSVLLDDQKSIVRTYVDAGKNIVLIPANNEFETLTIPKNRIKILGKVKSYTVDL